MNNKDDIVERIEEYISTHNVPFLFVKALNRIKSDAKRIAELEAEVERLSERAWFDIDIRGREYGPWMEWRGESEYGPEPLVEDYVQVYRRSPTSDHWLVTEAHHVNWLHDGGPHDVLAYRVHIPKQEPTP